MTCFLKVTVSEVEWEHKEELSSGSYSSCSGKLLDVNHEHLLQEKKALIQSGLNSSGGEKMTNEQKVLRSSESSGETNIRYR